MKTMVVKVPVTNLRREPKEHEGQYKKEPHQESQLLFGEYVVVNEERDDWMRLEAIEQAKHSVAGQWIGYPGWVKREHLAEVSQIDPPDLVVDKHWAQILENDREAAGCIVEVSFGTALRSIEKSGEWWKLQLPDAQVGYIHESAVRSIAELASRQEILAFARQWLGAPYLWGGRSAYRPKNIPLTSVDCSGLTQLIFRVCGYALPRDAHDQYLMSRPLAGHELKVADLIFLAEVGRPHRISHVMVYAGEETFIEAVLASECVREVSCTEKLGKPLRDLTPGEKLEHYFVYFGRFID